MEGETSSAQPVGDEKNTDILMAFLNGIFEDSGEPLVESVQILNPFIEKDALTDKMSILDIQARTQAQTIVNIEIQVRQTGEMRERSLYYWAKRYQSQLKAGDPYGRLGRVVVINGWVLARTEAEACTFIVS